MPVCMWFAALLALCAFVAHAEEADAPLGSADQVFSALRESVFQVRIIELQSGSQVALGTGFVVQGQRIATNYHVVSQTVLEPQKYRIEIALGDAPLALSVLSVDVVNDLALLNPLAERDLPRPFRLAQQQPRNGEVVYSLGNPHNLGMTIVTGNYNGLIDNKYLDRIHFSGAINSGMSGGPAVNARAQVVGINVATAGNQVGFLVPVAALSALIARTEQSVGDAQLLEDMATQIGDLTNGMVNALLRSEWPTEPMGKAAILGETVKWMECWGNSNRNRDTGVLEIARGCHNNDTIYIRQAFNTGYFEYEYYHLEAADWPSAAFYRLMRTNTSNARAGNRAGRDDVGNFDCHDSVIRTQNGDSQTPMRRRVSYCVRPYKRLPGLFDVFYMGVSLDGDQHAVMDHFTLAGVTQVSAQAFLQRFLEVTAWR